METARRAPAEALHNDVRPTHAVRLSCRYSNGISLSLPARLVSFDGIVLVVQCGEELVPGANLKVSGVGFGGSDTFRVSSCSRIPDVPGRYEAQLLRVSRILVVDPNRKVPALLSHAALRLAHEFGVCQSEGKSLDSIADSARLASDYSVKALAIAVIRVLLRKKLASGRLLRQRLGIGHE